MKKIRMSLALFLAVACMCSSITVKAAQVSYGADQTENMAGKVWTEGDIIRTDGCALGIAYTYDNPEGTQQAWEKIVKSIESYADSIGYVPMQQQGAGDKIYFISDAGKPEQVYVLVLGDAGTLEYGEDSGGMRRFAHSNTIWAPQEGAQGWQVVSCEEQDYYIGDDGENYPCFFAELAPVKKAVEEVHTDSAAACSHVYDYEIVQEPLEKEDGTLAKYCIKCGTITEYQPISAMAAFLKNAEKKIRNAEGNAVVTIETDRWLSFDQAVIRAIADRPDVTVVIKYCYQRQEYTLTIPAGTDMGKLQAEDGFYGFRYLDLILGGAAITK